MDKFSSIAATYYAYMYTYNINYFILLCLITVALSYIKYIKQLIGILVCGESDLLEVILRV